MSARSLLLALVLAVVAAPAAAAGERPVRLTDSVGQTYDGALVLPRGYGPAWSPPLPLVLVPADESPAGRWRGLPERGGFALLRLRGGPARVDAAAIERLGDLPASLRRSVPWLRLAPGRIYAFGAGEAGRRALRLAVARPRLLAGVAVAEPFGAGETIPTGATIAFSQVPVQLWTSTGAGRLRSAGLVRSVRTARAGGRILAGRGAWPTDLEKALLGFGLLPLESKPVERRAAAAPACAPAGPLSYAWPVRPFGRPHPVRGNVGDPRTHFDLGEPASSEAAGRFAFHDGVDVVAPGGTPVYPVVSGRVEPAGRYGVIVRAAGGRSFVYQHLLPAVRAGAEVRAGETVLGHVLARSGHVHLGEFAPSGAVVNPLEHLTPYRDTTAPVLALLEAPASARGRLELSARAYDVPELAAGGAWTGLPVAPSRITLSLRNRVGRTVTRAAAVDFVDGLPGNAAFRDVYLPGTRQNASVVGFHYFTGSPGSYRYPARARHPPGRARRLRPRRPGHRHLRQRGRGDALAARPARPELPAPATEAEAEAEARPRPAGSGRATAARPALHRRARFRARPGGAARPPPRRLHERAGRGSTGVTTLRSDRYGALTPGYLVVVSGAYASAGEAARAALPAARAFPSAYPRFLGKERPARGRKGRE